MAKKVIRWDEGKQSLSLELQPNGEVHVTGASGTVCIPLQAIRQVLGTLYDVSAREQPSYSPKEAPNQGQDWREEERELLKRQYRVLRDTAVYLLAADWNRTTEAIEWQLQIKP